MRIHCTFFVFGAKFSATTWQCANMVLRKWYEKEQILKKRYVKDYVPTKDGNYKYQGKYYQSRISEKERKKEGRIQILYGITCLAMLLLALCIPCNGNRTVYIVIPLELTFICLWIYLVGSFALLNVENRMEQKEYDKVYQSPIQSLTIAIIIYIFSIVGQMIGVLMNSFKRSRGDIWFVMILFFVLVMSCVIWNRQRKMMHSVTEEKTEDKNNMSGE